MRMEGGSLSLSLALFFGSLLSVFEIGGAYEAKKGEERAKTAI